MNFKSVGIKRTLIGKQIDKTKKKETATTIPLLLKHNRTLPKIKEIVMKHWHLLHINPNLAEIIQNSPILVKTSETTFRSNQTNIIFQIYHNLNCKSKYVIYLLKCIKCTIQCVGKAETEFNIRLNNHREDVWKPDAIPASRHFSDKNYNFNTHAKFTLIEQIRHIDIDKEKNNERLKQREYFGKLTLETLTPKGLNQELH